MLNHTQQRFIDFILQREEARVNKLRGEPRPWCADPIIAERKFCNVNREDDAVTMFIQKVIRQRLSDGDYGIDWCVINIFLARLFNHQPVLREMLCPVDILIRPTEEALEAMYERIEAYAAAGNTYLRGAYYVVVHGEEGKGKTTLRYYTDVAKKMLKLNWDACADLHEVAELMLTVSGIGPFYCNQVVTDLRYLIQFEHAYDWSTFVWAGPGTQRGLNRFFGRDVKKAVAPKKATAEILQVRKDIQDLLPPRICSIFHDPNNLSNCFCEFDKYERALDQELDGKRITIHKYTGKSN